MAAAIALALIVGVSVFDAARGGRDPTAPVAGASQRSVRTPARAPDTSASRLDFDSADNLYALATAALDSDDPMTLHNGRHAALACTAVLQTHDQYEALARGEAADAIALERRRAARVLLHKCAGFFDNDAAANGELKRRLRDRLLAHDGEYIPGSSQGGPTDRQIAMAIERGDWQIFVGAFSELVPRMAARAGIEPDAPDGLLLGVAMLQSLCDIGQDCSPDGLGYVARCADHLEMCAGSWAAFYRRGVSPAQQEVVQARRPEIVDAYRRKDFAYFGLAP